MALISPGVEVTIIDESQYVSARIGTVPYILMATAENKLDPSGTDIAPGTISSATNDVYLITSQRELANTFGNPLFYKTSGGNPINGYELNEYGLMAAYSVLGTTNRVYVQRADIDLNEISASLVRPTSAPNEGTFWFDLASTQFGIFEWSSVTNRFTNQVPLTIIDDDLLDAPGGNPLGTVGSVGDYAVVATNANNPIYQKSAVNTWNLIGSDTWKDSIPALIGSQAAPVTTATDIIDFVTPASGAISVTLTGVSLATTVVDINTGLGGAAGLRAAAVNDKIEFYVEQGIDSADSSTDVSFQIADNTGTPLADLGLVAGTYNAPIVTHAPHTLVPRWRDTDPSPRPSLSVWMKTTDVNLGASTIVKRYDTTTAAFIEQAAPLYINDQAANAVLDAGSGGSAIAASDTYSQYDSSLTSAEPGEIGTLKIFEREPGQTSITGTIDASGGIVSIGDTFTISVSLTNDPDLTVPVSVVMTGTTGPELIADLLAAGIPNITASMTVNNYVNIIHIGGGVIEVNDVVSGPIAAIGISDAQQNVRRKFKAADTDGTLILSNWNLLTYVADVVEPGQDPLDGTRWYYSEIDDVDIMIQDSGAWRGYKNTLNDIRGHDLTLTDDAGALLSANAPDSQRDGTNLVHGDLWIDTSDLENWPVISRWEDSNGVDAWVLLDNADQTTTEGVLFQDARWGGNDAVDPTTDDFPLTADLLSSDYIDIDAPNPVLYPEGMLLFNLRRSGFNVKEFRVDYFNGADFPSTTLPTETDAWVTVSGNKDDGSPNMGRQAQRALVIAAMKSAIDTSEEIREEQRSFNLLTAPSYPELMTNMVALNNERNNTGFILGDTPLRLSNQADDLAEWATNNGGLGTSTDDGLNAIDEYLGTFYPSGQTTDLGGDPIVVPPSHAMLRTIIHSDEQSYPWFAPAGDRRGQIDNLNALGYIDEQTGEFIQISNRQGVRDVLYDNNVNPLTFMSGTGLVNWGNKTTKSGSA
ncbi:MAG: hypothetical protein DRQ40_09355, partial [Gammaproteobacteria bacterium]